jgi:tetratricopeptide (TPR) repeat protein
MPALLSPPKLEALWRKMAGATQERMLREMAEALETLTGAGAMREPSLLVLVLEDLQWSDHSTLELIAALARRREKARLLVIGTSRPVETLETEHPLRAVMQELQLHQQCKELRLELLTEAAVEEYLAVRSPGGATGRPSLQQLARRVHQRTEGNPLFMVNVVDYLIAGGILVEHRGQWGARQEEEQIKVPENIRQMIVKQIERLSPEEQRVLEVASAAGAEFSAAAVAAAVEAEISEVEEKCEGLARRAQFLQVSGVSEWPDGTVAARYRFLHALYQEVLYGRVTAGRRQRLHQRIGEREETAYGTQAGELATELAMHFERGRDYHRAVRYLQQAGENAQRRSAHREAINHLTKGLELLKALPHTPERAEQELRLQVTLGPSLISTKGYGVPEVERAYTRARELCRQVGETPQLFPVLLGLLIFYTVRAEYQTAHELGERCLSLAQRVQDPALITATQSVLPIIMLFLGELTVARAHAEQGIASYDPQQPRSWLDHGVACLSEAAWVLWLLGYPDQALRRSDEMLTLAQELSHPFSFAYALFFASGLHQLRRETHAAQERAETAITLSTEQGFPTWLANGMVLRGWALAEQGGKEEGIAQIREGLAARQAMGEELLRPYFLALLAEAYGRIREKRTSRRGAHCPSRSAGGGKQN